MGEIKITILYYIILYTQNLPGNTVHFKISEVFNNSEKISGGGGFPPFTLSLRRPKKEHRFRFLERAATENLTVFNALESRHSTFQVKIAPAIPSSLLR